MHNPEKHAPGDGERRRTFAGFLIDSEVKPFVVLGKCVQYFGWGAVAGFFLGAVCVYGYAIVKPLPFGQVPKMPVAEPTPTPLLQPKTVQLRGIVRDRDGKPMNDEFWVGVFAKQLGPIQNSDGSFALEVPQSNTYDVALWTSEKTVNVYTGFAAEQDGNGYRLQQALPFLQTVRTVSLSDSRLGDFKSRPQLARSQIGGP